MTHCNPQLCRWSTKICHYEAIYDIRMRQIVNKWFIGLVEQRRKDIVGDIKDPGMEGVYTANSSYRLGRPVLQHSGVRFTLSVEARRMGVAWYVSSGVCWYLHCGLAPSMCPADPRAARNERLGEEHWSLRYYSKKRGWDYCRPCRGTSLKCNKHLGPGLPLPPFPWSPLHQTKRILISS